MTLSIPSSNIDHPQPILTNNEFEDYVEQSSKKLWTNDSEINDRIFNKNVIMSTNIHSLARNHSELTQISLNYAPVVIVLREIWNPHIGAVNLKGFHQLIAKTRPLYRGGGVGIYISKQ